MSEHEPFVDYYAILEVNPGCSQKDLELAYRRLAKKYHPDHPETADSFKFNEVVGAYRILRKAQKRAEYDEIYAGHFGVDFTIPPESGENGDEKFPLSDAEAHTRMLLFLYRRRRENAQDAGVGRFYVQKMLGCTDENFEFHIWYLKSKGLIETTEQGTLAITIEGVDHVMNLSRTAAAEQLLIGRSAKSE